MTFRRLCVVATSLLLLVVLLFPYDHRSKNIDMDTDTDAYAQNNAIILPIMVIIPRYDAVVENLVLSPRFTPEEVSAIEYAAQEWETASSGIVRFQIMDLSHFSPINDGVRSGILYKSATVRPANELEPIVLQLDDLFRPEGSMVIGYYDAFNAQQTTIPDLFYIPERVDDSSERQRVIMHELGHSISMGHIGAIDSVMNGQIMLSANGIMEKDLEQLCALYVCDAEFLNPDSSFNEAPECVSSDFN